MQNAKLNTAIWSNRKLRFPQDAVLYGYHTYYSGLNNFGELLSSKTDAHLDFNHGCVITLTKVAVVVL